MWLCSSDAAPSEHPQDADIGQYSYLRGDHSITPDTHWARPLVHTLLSTGRQIVFTASTENRVRTFDTATGELINKRQILPPWPMQGANCTKLGQSMGIMGMPVTYTDYDDGIAFFYAKSYIEDYRVPGGAAPPLNGIYYHFGIYLNTLQDLHKFPLPINDLPHNNDSRKMSLRGSLAVNLRSRNIYRWATQAGPDPPTGGIWQSEIGIASNGRHVYLTTDNGGSVETNVSGSPIGGFAVLDETFKTTDRRNLGVATSRNSKMYMQDLDNLGGFRQGRNGTDSVPQTIYLHGEVYGYIYVDPGNAPLSAYAFKSSNSSNHLFTLAGKSAKTTLHSIGVGTPTVTSDRGTPRSGIVWVTDVEKGLLAYKAVPENESLVKIPVPKLQGAMKFGRPVFGDGRATIKEHALRHKNNSEPDITQ
ncbi:hypothetical protein EK21DRAFT_102458 [Setomelanomma holmii]|uniref:Uncharacterized protein n=1 Tax=Setomelanomma holmii TaxID=210430 RepID=A0A9P4LKZ2_9PLEO|nr:hypothetical protein EK21DRAFT_102458 [Setomelanomma holmii]